MSPRDWPGLRRLFRLPATRGRVRTDVMRELEFHIDGRIEELMANGLSRDDAEREARRRFGDYRRIESEVAQLDLGAHRRRTLAERWDALVADVKYSVRTLAKQPIFASVVVITLTLGIAATTAIFHAVDRVVLHPLPYPDPDRIVYLGWQWRKGSGATALSPAKLMFWRAESRVFEGVGTTRTFEAAIGDGQTPSLIRGVRVTQDYLRIVGATPVIGRSFADDEYIADPPPVALLGHALWTAQFGGDRTVIGKTIRLEGKPYTVIGVLPKWFQPAEAGGWSQVVLPLAFTQAQMADGGNNYTAAARLRPGLTPAQIDADMASVFARYKEAFPELTSSEDRGVRVAPFQEMFLGDLASSLFTLLGATAFVLLLACANVANLLFARTLGRQREFAVRTALGAGRRRLARQIVLEMLLLGAVSAGLATVASLAGMRAIVAFANSWVFREDQLQLDPRAVLYTASIAVVASLAIGFVVALATTRVDLARALGDGGRGASTGRRQKALRSTLVSTETAIATVLLAGAGLLIASFLRLLAVDPGFQREGVFTATTKHAPPMYDSAAAVASFERAVLERLKTAPGILSAGSTSSLPLIRGWNLSMTVEGRPDATEGGMEWRSASADYFRTFDIRPIIGRGILETDAAGAPPVVVISQSFANAYWPGESPIGRRLLLGRFKGRLIGPQFDDPPREIVGVVPDMRDMRLEQKMMRHTAWVPRAQVIPGMMYLPSFAVRATDAVSATKVLRTAIAEIEPRMAAPEIASMSEILSASLSYRRFYVVLMSVFAFVALTLTCVGIYGAVSFVVAQRSHEIGIRMALGALPRSVVAMSVIQGMRPAIIGLVVGLGGALALSRLMTNMLYEVGPRDPLPLAVVAALLVVVAFVASYIPARRAARVDPLTALRNE